MYQKNFVEELLRDYYSLTRDLSGVEYKADVDMALIKLKNYSGVLYSTIVNVFINAKPIGKEAKDSGVSRMHVNRRLHDGLHLLTMIMNGEYL